MKGKVVFYASGQPVEENPYPDHLRKIISYSDCLRFGGFTTIVGSFLAKADLSRANLSRAILSSANLSRANLSRASLRSADLSRAILTSAILADAILSSADLSSAILTSADFTSVNLSDANLKNIIWNEDTNWTGVIGLETAQNVPVALEEQLGL